MTISWKNAVWLSVALLNPPLVKADDTSFNVQFIGTIVGESCNVDTNSAEQTIDLGEFTTEEFPRVGATTPEKQFAITLKTAPAQSAARPSGLPATRTTTIPRCLPYQIREKGRST